MTLIRPRIAILTGGGDCPGLNAAIRGVARTAMGRFGAEVIGIEDGFEGLVSGAMRPLSDADISGIIALGGTILGTSNKGDPFRFPLSEPDGSIRLADLSKQVVSHLRRERIDALVAIGGDGTMHIAHRLLQMGVNVVGVPKTIDNDLAATDQTFGFDTAVAIVCESIDRLHTTAASHHRVMVVETMGRYAGWIALAGGVASGADVILIPEIDWAWAPVLDKISSRDAHGKRSSIVCVAEGARLPAVQDGEREQVVQAMDIKRTDPARLGGIGARVAAYIEAQSGHEARVCVLGHLQRGGSPTAFDRQLATHLGALAGQCACTGVFGVMTALRGTRIEPVPLAHAITQLRRVDSEHPLIVSARMVGVCLGDQDR